jgi:hypothetical protein
MAARQRLGSAPTNQQPEGGAPRMDDATSSIASHPCRRARRVGVGALLCVLAAAWAGPAAAQTAVDLELLLAVDASGSVDEGEFDLQRRGLADAFRDPDVASALAAYAPAGVAVSLMQWSGRSQQVVVIDWMRLGDPAAVEAFAAAVGAAGRQILGETAIADALSFAIDQLQRNRFAGARRVIDLSGDGATNAGSDPNPVRDAAIALGITINGLAIVNEAPALDLYYAEHVVGGPGAFTIVAKDYQDFADAIRRKLLREIEGAGLAARERAPTRLAGRR